MGDAHVGEGAAQSMHLMFWGEYFWIERSWVLASSTGMSAAIVKSGYGQGVGKGG